MLMVASHKNVPPNWADTAGPSNHSPAPMDEPARRIPGPISEVQLRHVCAGAAVERVHFPGRHVPRGDERLLFGSCRCGNG